MFLVSPGQWKIRSVTVNSEPALEDNGFHELYFDEKVLRIEPAGISLNVNQATARSAVLESRSQVFYADFSTRGDELIVRLSRPQFDETVFITAVSDRQLSLN